MCKKPEPPDNKKTTEGEQMKNISFNELYDAITNRLSNNGDKPIPPDNTTTTRGGGNSDRPIAPPNQEITKGD